MGLNVSRSGTASPSDPEIKPGGTAEPVELRATG